METLRKLRFVLYPSVFLLVFIFASYCTFPERVLRDMAESTLTYAAMGAGPKNRGVPVVAIDDVSLWQLSGMSLDKVSITWPPKQVEAPLVIEVDSLKARLGIFAALAGGRSIYADAHLYEGDFSSNVKLRKQKTVSVITASASKINLAKMTFLETLLGAPLKGLLNASVDLSSSTEMAKDGVGFVRINFDNLMFGPGSINLPAGGFVSSLTVPQVSLGKLTADLNLDKGLLSSKTFTLTGGDLEADLKLEITLGRKPTSSRVSGDGWFSVKSDFVAKNETLKMLFDLIPELKAAQQGDGKVGLMIRGNLARPQFKLERYTGSKRNDKKDPVANN